MEQAAGRLRDGPRVAPVPRLGRAGEHLDRRISARTRDARGGPQRARPKAGRGGLRLHTSQWADTTLELPLARRVAPDGLSIGIDQDDMALAAATERFSREVPEADFLPLKGNFGDLDRLLVEAEVPGVDCFLFDLGVSSPQLDIPERGFSYHEDAPLDMRMDSGNNTLTAQEVVNTYNEADLTRILRVYGDERLASKIARRICETRAKAPIETTLQLVDVIKAAIPAAKRRSGGHPARKTFQALRIEVNHELEVLDRGLRAAVRPTGCAGLVPRLPLPRGPHRQARLRGAVPGLHLPTGPSGVRLRQRADRQSQDAQGSCRHPRGGRFQPKVEKRPHEGCGEARSLGVRFLGCRSKGRLP